MKLYLVDLKPGELFEVWDGEDWYPARLIAKEVIGSQLLGVVQRSVDGKVFGCIPDSDIRALQSANAGKPQAAETAEGSTKT